MKEQDWEESQLETGHSAESRRLLGMQGSVCGGSGVHLPQKKIPGCQGVAGDAFSTHSHFSHRRPNLSFIPTKLCPLAQSYVCQTCPVTPQDWHHPSSPRTASIAPTWTSRQLGPQSLRAATRVWAPSLGCLETTDPRKEARHLCLPGAPEETSVTWLPPRFESAASSRAIFGGRLFPLLPLGSLFQLIPP